MPFRPEKLTVKAQESVQNAHALAEEQGHRQIAPLHLLKALLKDTGGIPQAILVKIGANIAQLEQMIEGELKRLPSSSGSNIDVGASRELMQVLEEAQKIADSMQDQFASTEHLLLALTKVEDSARRLLSLNGIE